MVLISGLGRKKRRNEIIAEGKVWDEGMVVSRAWHGRGPLEVHPRQPLGQVQVPHHKIHCRAIGRGLGRGI